jgi:uncharacterized protein (DUF488 family)
VAARLFTIGHSSRTLGELLDLVRAHTIARVVDIRRFPASRRHPHFGRAPIEAALVAAGIGYDHRPGLGGMRDPDGSDVNAGIADPRLRGYADHMQTPAFDADLNALAAAAADERLACMCAEADPARCHRALLSDALLGRGVAVEHILELDRCVPHVLSEGASLRDGRVAYPARQSELKLF